MAITISGENNNDRILAQDGVIDQISGINIVGLITASHINVGSNIQLGNAGIITATTFVGNVTGNVNSTSPLLLQTGGSERFRITSDNALGIAGANYGSSGQVLTSGGSGSAVTWSAIPTQVTISNNADNRVITGGTGTNLVGEPGLTFDGSELDVNNGAGSARLYLISGNSSDSSIYFGRQNDGATAGIRYDHSDDSLRLYGYNNSERLRIDSNGRFLLGTVRTYGTGPYYDDICINNSDGSGSAGGAGIDLISKSDNYGAITFSNESQHERGYIKFEHNSGVNKLRFGTLGADRWQIYSGGNLQPASDSAYDIGSNAVRVRNVYADTYYGSGANLTSLPTQITINNNSNGRVITATGNANELDSQPSLSFSASGGDPKLYVSGSGHAQLFLTNTSGADHTGVNFGDSADTNAGMIQYSNSNNAMQFHTNGAEKLRIDSDGHAKFQHGLSGFVGGGVVVCAAKSSSGTANQSNYKVDFVVPMGDLGNKHEYEDVQNQFTSGQTGKDYSHAKGGSGILIATVQNDYYWGYRTKIYHITTYGNSTNNVTAIHLLHNYSAAGHGSNSASIDLAVQSHGGSSNRTPTIRATFSGDYWNSNTLTVTFIGSSVASFGNIRSQLTSFDSALTGQDPTWK